MTKEKLRDGLLKLSYGISGELDEYQRQRLDHLGNSGYLLLTLFTPLLLLVAMVLALTTTYKIAFLFAFISILTLFIVVTWYFYLVMGKERVLINELPTKELKKGSQAGDYHRLGCGWGWIYWRNLKKSE